MAWDELIDQERVIQALQGAVERGRVAHAYLFYGPDGVGKRATALEFARVLECEQGGSEACGRCLSCSKVRRMIHPDVHVFFPYPADTAPEEIAERLQRLGENPYAAVDFVRRPSLTDPAKTSNKQSSYPVARINEDLRRSVSFMPVEGRYKVAILTDADLLRIEASNAFLKLLEEPPPRTVFILTTCRPDRLLPTIVSRCQRFRFDTLPDEAIEQALAAREEVAPKYAAVLARMADGSYSRALELKDNEDLGAHRDLVLAYFRAAYVRNIDGITDLVEQMAGMGRERVKGVFGLMIRWLRDLMLFRVFGAEAPLVNVDQAEAIGRFCNNIPEAEIEGMTALVEEAIELVERNVHLNLVLTALSQMLYRVMRGERGLRLYIPLVAASAVELPA